MPKYWVKNYFAHGRFLEVGQKQKTEKRERLNDGDNNGQATHGARKHAWRTQAAWAKKKKKVGENNGQLRIHGSCLDQLYTLELIGHMFPYEEYTLQFNPFKFPPRLL